MIGLLSVILIPIVFFIAVFLVPVKPNIPIREPVIQGTTVEVPISSPIPVIEETATPTIIPRVIATQAPQPTTDPDPIVNCIGKQQTRLVRRSVCNNSTECSDGNGGYVIESQSACKERWDRISKNLGKAAGDYAAALSEQNKLQSELWKQQSANWTPYPIPTADFSNINIPKQTPVTITITTPAPTPNNPQGAGRLY